MLNTAVQTESPNTSSNWEDLKVKRGKQLGRRIFLFHVLLIVKSHFSLSFNQALNDSQ